MADEIFSEEALARLGQLETILLGLSSMTTRKQNRDDLGVAVRYIQRLLAQYSQELDMLQTYLDQFEATLNLLEARYPS